MEKQLSLLFHMITVQTTRPGVSTAAAHNEIFTNKEKQRNLALSLFVLRILTDNSDASFSFNDFAFLANRLN